MPVLLKRQAYAETTPYNKLSLAWDPAIASSRLNSKRGFMVSLRPHPLSRSVVLHGLRSDILPTPVVQEMTQRGPRAELVEFAQSGHAAGLMDRLRLPSTAMINTPIRTLITRM